MCQTTSALATQQSVSLTSVIPAFGVQAVITSYNFLGQLRDTSKDLTFRVVIMDEAHYIKNKKARPPHLAAHLRCVLLPIILSAAGVHPSLKEAASGTWNTCILASGALLAPIPRLPFGESKFLCDEDAEGILSCAGWEVTGGQALGPACRAHHPADRDARHVTSQGALHSGASSKPFAPEPMLLCLEYVLLSLRSELPAESLSNFVCITIRCQGGAHACRSSACSPRRR